MSVEHHAPRVHDSGGKVAFRARERVSATDGYRPRGYLQPRLFFFHRGNIEYERKWAKKPIHRFLNRVPLQMSSRGRLVSPELLSACLCGNERKACPNAGKFRADTCSQMEHSARSDNLSSSNFSLSSSDRSDRDTILPIPHVSRSLDSFLTQLKFANILEERYFKPRIVDFTNILRSRYK